MPPVGSTVFAIPMNLRDGSGAPVRVFAMLNKASLKTTSRAVAAFVIMSLITRLLLT